MDTALALLQAENARLRVQLAERDAALAVAAAQIEALSFNLAVLKRRQFGQSSEKLAAEIEQLELRLEDLEESRFHRTCRARPWCMNPRSFVFASRATVPN